MKFREELEKYYIAMQDKSINDIVLYISTDAPEIKLSENTIRNYIYKIRREHEQIAEINDTPAWEVIDNNYIFEHKGRKKVFSVAMIDDIFLHYSRRGYNFTRARVQQRFKITPKTFHAIQQKFHLSKDSDIISPFTKTKHSPEELQEILDGQIHDVLSSGEMTAQRYNEAIVRKYRKIIDEDNLDHTWRNEVFSELLSSLPNCINIELKASSAAKRKEILATCADIHSGSDNDKMKITESYSMEIMIEKLHRMAHIINQYEAEYVDLAILGDLVETISGINHPDSWKGIAEGMFGANIIIQTYEILIEHLINRIHNLRRIIGCGGNHDRLQASNKNADTGATDLVFYMLKERLALSKSNVEVIYDPVIVAVDLDGFGFIGVHGDKGLHKRSLEYLITRFAINKNNFQFVQSAHLHSFFCQRNDSMEIGRRFTIPSIVTGNEFSDVTVGRSDKSGFSVICQNDFKEPDMYIHNI